MPPNSYTEDHLVEQPALQLLQHELGWEVVLVSRLRPALQRLNPDLPVEQICRDFHPTALSFVRRYCLQTP